MAMLAWIVGIIAALCMVMGIITAVDIISPLGAELTWMFWFILAGVLLLVAITCNTYRGGSSEY